MIFNSRIISLSNLLFKHKFRGVQSSIIIIPSKIVRKYHINLRLYKSNNNKINNNCEMKYIPITEACFDRIRIKNGLYIDKTEQIYNNLFKIKGSVYYFFVRPRRFGKSLLCSTISNLFGGNSTKELFKGLWIYDSNVWDFEKENHPVIHLDMSAAAGANSNVTEFESDVRVMLMNIADMNQVQLDSNIETSCIQSIFLSLIFALKRKHNGKNVVIIIDEYDKPILDLIDNPKEMEEVRKSLQTFYSILKSQESNLRLLFMTGCYKFNAISMFSTLNNLNDISMNLRAGTLCGYTENEIRQNFQPHMQKFKKVQNITDDNTFIHELHTRYNGYTFGLSIRAESIVSESVYNPFTINHLFHSLEYSDEWISSGTATMISEKLVKVGDTYDLLLLASQYELLASCEPSNMSLTTLMYYGGYSTIDQYDGELIRLKIPNISIKQDLSLNYMSFLVKQYNIKHYKEKTRRIHNILICTPMIEMNTKIIELQEIFHYLLTSYPYDYMKNESLFQTFLTGIFFQNFWNVILEETTRNGRIDITINHELRTFIIECNYNNTSNIALNQTKEYRRSIENNNLPKLYFGINILNKDKKSNNKSIEIIYDYE